ncbi:response regulator [Vibrio bivalvicida]|uniref:Two-component system response regulator n=1 Tax=Vibrio bivalvicida TaxID=1276888 RepID=A0A177XVN9_9VIBR|nr:response regulator [Vibrio bivalvicida]OAJ92681.1 two-component system response regulator [Vibrio bivalvicida]
MKILVCDDSVIARKSIIGRIAPSTNLTIHQAEHGKEALEIMLAHDIDLLFLDLTMPVMDGFEVLASVPVNHYPTQVVVVSGDIQLEAKSRCKDLGAKHFIEKPFVTSDLVSLFEYYQLPLRNTDIRPNKHSHKPIDLMAAIREMSNVALGASASLISQQMGRFIEMPLPNVASLHQSELTMTVQDIVNNSESRAVSQRFVGNGINGEALVCLHGSGFELLVSTEEDAVGSSVNEVILDLSNLLVSSFLNSFSKQLDIAISLRQPIVLEKELLQVSLACDQFLEDYEQDIFTIEFVYKAENLDIACDIIFLMDYESLNAIEDILESVL